MSPDEIDKQRPLAARERVAQMRHEERTRETVEQPCAHQ